MTDVSRIVTTVVLAVVCVIMMFLCPADAWFALTVFCAVALILHF